MNQIGLMRICLAVFLLSSLCTGARADDYPWKGAVAKVDITPKEMMWMGGYSSRKGPAEGVLQPIHAKVLTLEDADGARFVFVTMDLIGVPRSFRDDVERMVAKDPGIPPEALLINASHTHSSPMIRTYKMPGTGKEVGVYANIPDEEQDFRAKQTRDYLRGVADQIYGLIRLSVSQLKPVTLAWAHSKCGFAMNRRTSVGPGEWKNSPNPDAPVDHEVPVLQMRAKDGDELLAVMFGYACHATTLSVMQISGDWPGYAQTFFEEDHPGTVAMFLNGCSGDQNPYPRRMLPYVERHGRSMATAIEAALETPAHSVAGPLRSALEWVDIPYQTPPSKEQLEKKAESDDRYDARHAKFMLEHLAVKGPLPESYPLPVQVVRFGGDLTLAAIGGEVVIDYALRLKRELGERNGDSKIWVAGYSNDVPTYIPSRRVLEEGGYEGGGAMRHVRSVIHPAPWIPEIEELIVGKILELNGILE